MDCPICDRIDGCRRGQEPSFIAELPQSIAVLHDHQPCEGWCVLWLKDHVEHLADLPLRRQAALWEDVARVAAAVRVALSPRRLNYACLGNQVPHVHWHVIPRHADDPDPAATVWSRPMSEQRRAVSPERRDALIGAIRRAGLR
jgi:diadenosine tetraphosphate (Ap4A) HIT family hydrolase